MLATLFLLGAQAQDDAPKPDAAVSGPRSVRAVTESDAELTVLEREALVATGETTLSRAIARAAGVWVVETNPVGGSVVLRGFSGHRVPILVDGVRADDSTTSAGPNQVLDTIALEAVERVEILRGDRSVLYGSGSFGGAIRVWTRRRLPAVRDAANGSRTFQGGLEGLYDSASDGGRGSASGSAALGEHGLFLVGGFHDFDNLKSGESEVVPFSAYHGHDFFGAYEWAMGEHQTLRATARAHNDFHVPRPDRLIAGFGQVEPSDQQWEYAVEDRRAYQLMYADEAWGGFADSMQLRLALDSSDERRDVQASASSLSRTEEDQVDSVHLGADWHKALGESQRLTFGVDASNDDVDSSRRATDLDTGVEAPPPGVYSPESRYTSAGAFVQDELLAFDPYFVTLGARYAFYDYAFRDAETDASEDGHFGAFSLSGEAAREIAKGVKLSATVARSEHAPNLYELSSSSEISGGTELPNPELDPETSLSGDVAVAVRKPMWGGSLASFVTHVDDLIGDALVDAGDPDVSGDETYLRENTGEARLYGLEAALDVRLIDASSPYRFVSSLAWTRGRESGEALDPDTGALVEYDVPYSRVPPLFGRAGFRYDGPYTRNYVDWAEVYVLWAGAQDQLSPLDETDPTIDPEGSAGWATFHLDLGGPIVDGAGWTLGFHNLFDKRYRVHGSGYDAPGASVVVGLHANF